MVLSLAGPGGPDATLGVWVGPWGESRPLESAEDRRRILFRMNGFQIKRLA